MSKKSEIDDILELVAMLRQVTILGDNERYQILIDVIEKKIRGLK